MTTSTKNTKTTAPKKKLDPDKRPGRTREAGAERKAAARALYEGQPGATCQTVADEIGVPWSTVKRWKAEGGWRPAIKNLPDMTARAALLADSFKTRVSELGQPLSDNPTADTALTDKVGAELSNEFAVDVRANILDRHRKEWAAPRKIAYTALQKGANGNVAEAFEMAKLAKISSETLSLIQAGECRAYGINHETRASDGQTVVVVERGNASPTNDPLGGISPSPETSTGGVDF